ncbi:MAG: glycosyltransferase family 4 protein [Deltaproteobacteria bacterium]|nr:glycosyltransferase family 4 protein [Deltaproteobacteria bacterium]
MIDITEYVYPANSNKIRGILDVKKIDADIFHITGDVNFLAYGVKKNLIITIHDLGHYEKTLKGLKKTIYKYLWLKFPLKKAKYIVAVSNFTKNRLLENYKIDPQKIKVIYNPYPEEFHFTKKIFNKNRPVILQIGSGMNKNVEGLIEAVKELPCKLIFIRKKNENLSNYLKRLKIDHEFHDNLKYEDVADKYIESDLVYFASTYEGFGMPIVEANAIGRPVITSNLASMPEIAGNAACFVDPYDPMSIRKGIFKIISDEKYRNMLIEKGVKNLKRFKIENIALKYLELYRCSSDRN